VPAIGLLIFIRAASGKNKYFSKLWSMFIVKPIVKQMILDVMGFIVDPKVTF
jgi:hypothetical protein